MGHCTLCFHDRRVELEAALIKHKMTQAEVGAAIGISGSAVGKHVRRHMCTPLEAATVTIATQQGEPLTLTRAELDAGIDVLQELQQLHKAVSSIFDEALQRRNWGLALRASDRLTREIDILAKVRGLYSDASRQQVAVFAGGAAGPGSEDIEKIRQAFIDALRDEAADVRERVARRLMALDTDTDTVNTVDLDAVDEMGAEELEDADIIEEIDEAAF